MNEYLFGVLCIIAMALLLWDLNKPFKARHVRGGYRKGSAYIARCRLFYITGVDRVVMAEHDRIKLDGAL